MNQSQGNHGNGRGPTQIGTLSADDVRERLWAYEDFTVAEEHQPFNVAGSFASFGFIGAAIRRTKKIWVICALLGILGGLGMYAKFPVAYTANATVLIKNNPGEDAISAMQTQVELVKSESVAAQTVKSLGLTQSVSSFRAAYNATPTTNQLMTITMNAPTADGAVQRANALAAQYLDFRADLLRAQLAQDTASYAQQVPQAQQEIASLQAQIAKLQGQPGPKLTNLQQQLKNATQSLPTVQQTAAGLAAEDRATTAEMIDGSQVLDAGTLGPHSTVKNLIMYGLIGLVAGLAIGLGFVIVRELISDRLRRRDDIVAALGAPVRLSVGPVAKGRLPQRKRRRTRRDLALRRVAAYLRNVALRQGGDQTTLAVVTVDNAQEIAPAVVMLAKRCARDGREVVVADLVKGAPVARRLGAKGTGAQQVPADGGSVTVITPEEDGQVASGPLRPASATGAMLLAEPPGEAAASAAKEAGFLITVTELDPAVGAEHLSTWATEAVAVFTAGRTRAASAYAVGEMLRLSGVRAISGVITASDTTDDSLGSVADDAAVLASLRTPERVPPQGGGGDDPAPGGKPGASVR